MLREPQRLAGINSNVSEFVSELVEPFTQQEVSGAVTTHPLRDAHQLPLILLQLGLCFWPFFAFEISR